MFSDVLFPALLCVVVIVLARKEWRVYQSAVDHIYARSRLRRRMAGLACLVGVAIALAMQPLFADAPIAQMLTVIAQLCLVVTMVIIALRDARAVAQELEPHHIIDDMREERRRESNLAGRQD